jgi:hypothetical protein
VHHLWVPSENPRAYQLCARDGRETQKEESRETQREERTTYKHPVGILANTVKLERYKRGTSNLSFIKLALYLRVVTNILNFNANVIILTIFSNHCYLTKSVLPHMARNVSFNKTVSCKNDYK